MEFDWIYRLGWPGWIEMRIRGEGEQPRVLAKVEEREGRNVVTKLILMGGTLDSATLRSIPIGRIEAALQHPGSQFYELLHAPIPPKVLSQFEREHEMFPKEFKAIDNALQEYEAKVVDRTEEPPVEPETARETLTRPDGTDPDGFARRVAQAYTGLVGKTSAPAKALADEAGVPVVTVHRWIAEARRRGHLPPARKGRAG